jgi:hypothetical protein
MTETLTYYAVAPKTIEAIMSMWNLQEVKGKEGETTISGKTPLGEVTLQVAYMPLSGQLTVVVLNRPLLLSVDTINAHIKTAIAAAAAMPL